MSIYLSTYLISLDYIYIYIINHLYFFAFKAVFSLDCNSASRSCFNFSWHNLYWDCRLFTISGKHFYYVGIGPSLCDTNSSPTAALKSRAMTRTRLAKWIQQKKWDITLTQPGRRERIRKGFGFQEWQVWSSMKRARKLQVHKWTSPKCMMRAISLFVIATATPSVGERPHVALRSCPSRNLDRLAQQLHSWSAQVLGLNFNTSDLAVDRFQFG